jgi:glutathione S-transferase
MVLASLEVMVVQGGILLAENTNPDMAAMKPNLPFGQLPFLEDGPSVKIAQSGAVIRYVAHKAKLDGRENDADFAMSEMLIEEMQDLVTLMTNAFRSPIGRVEAFLKLFAPDGPMRVQLDYLEKLIGEYQFCSRPLAGDCKYHY